MATPLNAFTSLPPLARRMFIGLLLSSLGSGLTLPFLYVYLAEVRHIGTSTVGLILAATGVVAFVTVPVFGSLIDHYGSRPVLIASLVIEAAGVAAVSQVRTAGEALALACAIAAGGSGIYPASAALLTRLVPEGSRQTAYGVQFMLLNAGLGLGGLVAALIVDTDNAATFERLYYLDGATYLGYIVVVLSLPRTAGAYAAPADEDSDPLGWVHVLRDRTLLFVVGVSILVVSCGYAQMETGFAAYAVTVADLDPRVLGVAYAANTAMIVFGQLVMLRLIDGRRRSRMLALASVGWSGSWLVIALSGVVSGWWAAVAAVVGLGLFGVAETLWAPVAPALVNALAPERLRGRYNAASSLAWTVSSVVGPASAGLLIGNGLAGAWVALTAGGTALAAGAFWLLGRRLTAAQDGLPGAGAPVPKMCVQD